MMISKLKKEWIHFRHSSNKHSNDGNNDIRLQTTDRLNRNHNTSSNANNNNNLSIGTVFSSAIDIYTFHDDKKNDDHKYNYNWMYHFFIPLGIVNTIMVLPFWIMMEFHHQTSDDGLNILHLLVLEVLAMYTITLSNAAIMQGAAYIILVSNSTVTTTTASLKQLHLPSWKDCMINTLKLAIPLFVITLAMVVPYRFMMQGITSFTDVFTSDNDDTTSLPVPIVFEVLFLVAMLYYCIVYTIIVIPCMIFEEIYNPIKALYRSYELTKGKRFQIFQLFFIVIMAWIGIEMLIDHIRFMMNGDYYSYSNYYYYYFVKIHNNDTPSNHHHLYLTLLDIVSAVLRSIPGIVFVPFVAILQTVIYIHVIKKNGIHANDASSFPINNTNNHKNQKQLDEYYCN